MEYIAILNLKDICEIDTMNHKDGVKGGRTMGARCQVCDGPVVNGRCKLCGMPYRNEEVLYHLNESRNDHYRHATSGAKKIMKKQEVPLGDKSAVLGHNTSREEIKAHHEKVRQDAVNRMNTTKTQPSGGRTTVKSNGNSRNAAYAGSTGSNKSTAYTGNNRNVGNTAAYGRTNSRKAGKTLRLIILLIFLLIALGPELVNYVKEKLVDNVVETGMMSEDIDSFYSWEDEYDGIHYRYFSLGREYGEVLVGTEMEAGFYGVSAGEDSAMVEVRSSSGSTSYAVSDQTPSYLMLSDGDEVWVDQDSDADSVIFVMIVDSGNV